MEEHGHMGASMEHAVAASVPAPSVADGGSAGRRRGAFAWAYLRRSPVSIAFAALILATGAITGSLWTAPIPDALGWSSSSLPQPATWWSLVTTLAVPDSTVSAIIAIVLSLTVLAGAEHLLGSRRTVVAMLVTGVAALFAGAGLQALLLGIPEVSESVGAGIVLDPTIAIAGAVVASSSLTGTLWRRRIRVVAFSVLAMFALYAGNGDSWFRLLAGLAGLAVGAVMASAVTLHVRPWHRSSLRETRSLVGAIVAVTGLGPMAALVAGGGRGPLSLAVDDFTQFNQRLVDRCAQQYAHFCDHQFSLLVTRGLGPAILALVPLVLLLLAAWGLRSGRRSAWMLALGVNAALLVLALITLVIGNVPFTDAAGGIDFEWVLWVASALAVPIGVIVLLVINRRRFGVRAPRRAVRTWLVTIGVAFVVCAAGFLVVSIVMRRSFDVSPNAVDLLVETIRRFVPPAFLQGIGQPPYPRTGVALWVYQWVGVVFWIVAIIATLRLYRATAHPDARAAESAELYRTLLRRGGGTLSFLGTWDGNAHWFSDDRQSAVAYRVVNGVALALADPLCPAGGEDAAIHGFTDFAIAHGWIPVFYSVHDDVVPVFESMGWHLVDVGQETVMHLPELEMTGKRWQKVRNPLNRAEREGMTAVWTTWHDLSPLLASQIIDISEQWVADKSLPEMGFTLGGLDEVRDPAVRLLLAIDADGRVQAVTSWMPSWRSDAIVGWTLDFMRRRDDAPNGVMEFLIARAALLMKDEGAEVLSLSGAPLATRPRAQGEAEPAPDAIASLLGWLSSALEPVYGFASLFRFKSKFLPEYRTLHMAYADPVELPAIGAAVGRAYLPDASTREYLAMARTMFGPAARPAADTSR